MSARIHRGLAEEIDVHRKARQAEHPDLTLTGMYNVLEKLRSGEALTAKERAINEHGLVGVLRSLHDELDAAVLQAYGWADLALPADIDTLLGRLEELNAKRAAEEATGTVRWLRPEFQQAGQGEQAQIEAEEEADQAQPTVSAATMPVAKRPWPSGLAEQIKAVADVLSTSAAPITLDDVAAQFQARGRWRDRQPTILETLGRARRSSGGRWGHSLG